MLILPLNFRCIYYVIQFSPNLLAKSAKSVPVYYCWISLNYFLAIVKILWEISVFTYLLTEHLSEQNLFWDPCSGFKRYNWEGQRPGLQRTHISPGKQIFALMNNQWSVSNAIEKMLNLSWEQRRNKYQ